MLIKSGSAVDIVSGPCAGQRGIVRDMRVCDERHYVMVFVDVLDLVAGRADLRVYEPENLKLRKRDDREMAALMDFIVEHAWQGNLG